MLHASDFRERARATLNGKWLEAVLVCFLAGLLGGGASNTGVSVIEKIGDSNVFDSSMNPYLTGAFWGVIGTLSVFLSIYGIAVFIIGSAVELGKLKYFVKLAYGQTAELKDEFSYFSYLGKALGLRIVMSVFITLWTLLLVIPGIIAAYRYSMAMYIMAEKPDIGIMEAIDESKRIMDGNKWRLFCLHFSFIGWGILCIFTFGIGALFLSPYMESATAHFYLDTKTRMAQNTQFTQE